MLRRPFAALALAAVLLTTVACSDDEEQPASGSDASVVAPTGALAVPPKDDGCFTLPPGQIYTKEQAVVVLGTQSVCPSFLTIRAGTELRFRNDDTAAHTVRLSRGSDPNKATQLAEQQIAPGATWGYTLGDPDNYLFTTDVLRTFLGVVQVQAAG